MYRGQSRYVAILGSSLLITMLLFVPEPSWAGCRNAGGGASSFAYGSQVDGESVTICASSETVVPARKSVVKTNTKTITKTTSTVTIKTPARTATKTVSNPARPSAAKPIVLPKSLRPATSAPKKSFPFQPAKPVVKTKTVVTPVVSKVVTKPKVTASTTTKIKAVIVPSIASSKNESAAFVPAAVSASVWPANQVEPRTPLFFNADALTHFRVGKILGKSAEVMFTPVSMVWNFDDGTSGSGLQVQHAFASEGNYQVNAKVVYAVSYRFVGQTSWLAEPGTISMIANLNVKVAAARSAVIADSPTENEPEIAGGARVALVGSTCQLRPASFGCG